MNTITAETQFSIYKLDYDAVESTFGITGKRGSAEYLENVTAAIINSVCSFVGKKPFHKFNESSIGISAE